MSKSGLLLLVAWDTSDVESAITVGLIIVVLHLDVGNRLGDAVDTSVAGKVAIAGRDCLRFALLSVEAIEAVADGEADLSKRSLKGGCAVHHDEGIGLGSNSAVDTGVSSEVTIANGERAVVSALTSVEAVESIAHGEANLSSGLMNRNISGLGKSSLRLAGCSSGTSVSIIALRKISNMSTVLVVDTVQAIAHGPADLVRGLMGINSD